jgi:plastocyanin
MARSRRGLWSVALGAGLLALAGCGNSSSTTSSPASTAASTPSAPAASITATTPAPAPANVAKQTLSLAANTEGLPKYNTKSLSAKAGGVTIKFTNASSIPHNVVVETSSGALVGETPLFSRGSKTLSVTLKRGTYKFSCTVPGHREAGMEGTLTVK